MGFVGLTAALDLTPDRPPAFKDELTSIPQRVKIRLIEVVHVHEPDLLSIPSRLIDEDDIAESVQFIEEFEISLKRDTEPSTHNFMGHP